MEEVPAIVFSCPFAVYDSAKQSMDFNFIIKNEWANMQQICETVLALQPKVIFLEKHINKHALEILGSQDVVIINNVKHKNI